MIKAGAKQSWKSTIFNLPWLPVLLASIAVAVLLAIMFPAFLNFTNFKNILQQAAFTAIISVGMTFVIMTGCIDISVGMNVFFMMALMYKLSATLPVWLCFVVAVLGGGVVGACNGFLVCGLDIVPMIATFSTMTVARGMGLLLINTGLKPVIEDLRVVGNTVLFGFLPFPIILAAIMAVLGAYLLRTTRFGRYVLAVGDSPTSARESGIHAGRIRFAAYVLCGLCAGLASLVYLGRVGIVTTDAAFGSEFTVITAVVLGGAKLSGGRGSITGSIIGCVFLILVENALSFFEVSAFFYDTVKGAFLLGAVILETVSTHQQKKALVALRTQRLQSGQ